MTYLPSQFGGGGKPTPDLWGRNPELLGSDKTLTNADDAIQAFNCNGADRRVKLPPEDGSNPLFTFINTSTDLPGTLIIQNDAGFVIARIPPGNMDWLVSSGVRWQAFKGGGDGGLILLKWGGVSPTGTSQYLLPNRTSSASPPSSSNPTQTDHIIGDTVPLIITHLSYFFANIDDPDYSLSFDIGGARNRHFEVGSPTSQHGILTLDPPIYVPAGDAVEVITNDTSAYSEVYVAAWCRIPGNLRGETLVWGADNNTLGYFFVANGHLISGSQSNSSQRSRHIISQDGTLDDLDWHTELGDATTVLKIHINGSVAHTETLSGATGSIEGLGLSVSEGDYIDIEYDAGTAPGRSLIYLSMAEYGVSLPFGGQLTSSPQDIEFYVNAQESSASVGEAILVLNDFYHFDRLVWTTLAGDATTEISIFKNGTLHQAVTLSGAQGIIDITDLQVRPGDFIRMQYSAGTAPNEGHYRLCENVD